MSPEELKKLMDDAERGANATLTIDLEARKSAGPTAGVIRFDIDPFRKHCLLNGLDDIGADDGEEAPQSTAFESKAAAARPWL